MTMRNLLYLGFFCLLLAGPASAVRSPGKPNAGLTLTSASHYQLQAGRVQSLNLILASAAQQGRLRITLSTRSPNLELLSPAQFEFDLSQQSPSALTVQLLPHQAGLYYLMLTAELVRQGQPPQAQSLGVAMQVGEPQATRRMKTTPAPTIISLPAQEVIYNH